ncbi:unnamed protein product [Durusdinium trenchii]|uniref:Uncharacterized protein n=1 Tax=Durusdinium trenchii TaxID=1381693 RepID=A0ABP0MRD4_9DINO
MAEDAASGLFDFDLDHTPSQPSEPWTPPSQSLDDPGPRWQCARCYHDRFVYSAALDSWRCAQCGGFEYESVSSSSTLSSPSTPPWTPARDDSDRHAWDLGPPDDWSEAHEAGSESLMTNDPEVDPETLEPNEEVINNHLILQYALVLTYLLVPPELKASKYLLPLKYHTVFKYHLVPSYHEVAKELDLEQAALAIGPLQALTCHLMVAMVEEDLLQAAARIGTPAKGRSRDPPSWSYSREDLRAFTKWERKVRVWQVQIKSYLPANEAAMALYVSLRGEAEEELEHADLSLINHKDGIDFILDSLRTPLMTRAIYLKRRYLSEFEQLNRFSGGTIRSFCNRYARTERNLRSVQINVESMYDVVHDDRTTHPKGKGKGSHKGKNRPRQTYVTEYVKSIPEEDEEAAEPSDAEPFDGEEAADEDAQEFNDDEEALEDPEQGEEDEDGLQEVIQCLTAHSAMDQKLTVEGWKEFRSMAGCLQWVASQSRPELAAVTSLSNKGGETCFRDLKNLGEALQFTMATMDSGIVLPGIHLNKSTIALVYADSSWANALNFSSQYGVLVTLCPPEVTETVTPCVLTDWKSGRSPRVCRSTLASEAVAADEGTDRGCHVNACLSELLYLQPAHKLGCRMPQKQISESKSLYDCVVSENPSVSDRRSLLQIRSVQQSIAPAGMRWVPTEKMHADGLTKEDKRLRDNLQAWLQSPWSQLREAGASKAKTSEIHEPHDV